MGAAQKALKVDGDDAGKSKSGAGYYRVTVKVPCHGLLPRCCRGRREGAPDMNSPFSLLLTAGQRLRHGP